jgi:proteasome lid subunit RPN8/RPN11
VPVLRLPAAMRDEIYAHGREEYPRECMGMIGGRGDELVDLYRMVNTSEIDKAYSDDPKENIDVGERMDERGQLPLVIYHSHPGTEAYFSETDEKVAREGIWGPIVYVVASIRPDADPYMKAFRIPFDDAPVEEVEIEIV